MTRQLDNCNDLRRQRGLTLVEVLIAMALLAVLMVPAMQALQNGFAGAEVERLQTDNHFRLVSRLERVLAEPYGFLEAAAKGPKTASSYSDDGATPAGILVYIAAYDTDNADADADPFTGADEDILWVSVAIDGGTQSLSTLRVR